MATEVLLVRDGSRLAAAEPISAETIEGLKHGEVVTCTIRRARNVRFHRKFMALRGVVFKAQTRYATPKQLLNAIKIATGYFEMQMLPGPIPMPICIPLSISFASMDEDSFGHFYNKAVEFILTEVLPGVDSDDLERQVMEILNNSNRRT